MTTGDDWRHNWRREWMRAQCRGVAAQYADNLRRLDDVSMDDARRRAFATLGPVTPDDVRARVVTISESGIVAHCVFVTDPVTGREFVSDSYVTPDMSPAIREAYFDAYLNRVARAANGQ